MSTIENYAVGDAVQIMVSTNGKNIHGKNRGIGPRIWQVGGYITDASLQKLSRGIVENTTINVSSGRESKLYADDAKADPTLEFRERSIGRQLTPIDTPNISSSEAYHRPAEAPLGQEGICTSSDKDMYTHLGTGKGRVGC